MSNRKRTVLLYGRTRAGKSTQIGELAEFLYKTTGKVTRLYTADRGGMDPVRPYVELGIIEVVEQGDSNPFIFLNRAVRGMMRDPNGKWIPGIQEKVGMYAFESMTSFADAIMAEMVKKMSEGVNIGGGANISFSVQGDGESLKVGGSNMAVFGVCQNRITEEVWTSQQLPGSFILWTASMSKDDDQSGGGKVLGPQVIGKALTSEVPRWFNLTFRIDAIPAQLGKPERHVLYLGNSLDVAAGNATSLGNTRTPLDGGELPATIEPASLVKAITLIDIANEKAMVAIRSRMNNTLNKESK